MLRQANIAPGSSLGEILLETQSDTTTADVAELFVFHGAKKLWLMEMGITCDAFAGGTDAAAWLGYKTAGVTGADSPVITDLATGMTVLRTHQGGARVVTAADQWRSERAAPHQPYLAELKAPDGEGANAFDSAKNMHLYLGIDKDGSFSGFTGKAWARVKVFQLEDLI